MPTFVLLTRMGPQFARDPRGRQRAGQDWKKEVDAKCPGIKWLAHYALLGRYDFIDIYEAPDVDTAFKVSYLSIERGAERAECWPAVGYEHFLQLVAPIE